MPGRIDLQSHRFSLLALLLAMGIHFVSGILPAQDSQTGKQAKPLADQVNQPASLDNDPGLQEAEQILRGAKLEVTGPAVLTFLRSQVPTAEVRQRFGKILADLGSDNFETREAASASLLKLGPSALPLVRKAVADSSDPEIHRRLEAALPILDSRDRIEVRLAACHILGLLHPAGTDVSLLDFLPLTSTGEEIDAIQEALTRVVASGKPSRELLAALTDAVPVRRAMAAEVLATVPDYREQVRPLLMDKDARVRASTALGLASAGERSAVRVLIESLPDLPAGEAVEFEDALYTLGGDKAPKLTAGIIAADRQADRTAFLSWWDKENSLVNPARLSRFEKSGSIVVARPANKDLTDEQILKNILKKMGGMIPGKVQRSPSNRKIVAFIADLGATDAHLKEITGLKGLNTLILPSCRQVTDAGVKELVALKNLHTLVLRRTGVTDNGVKELAAVKKLNYLNLDSTCVTDESLKELAAFKKLNSLHLSLCKQVTDFGLKELAVHKSLTTLDLSGTQVTEEGIKNFRKAVPGCKVLK